MTRDDQQTEYERGREAGRAEGIAEAAGYLRQLATIAREFNSSEPDDARALEVVLGVLEINAKAVERFGEIEQRIAQRKRARGGDGT